MSGGNNERKTGWSRFSSFVILFVQEFWFTACGWVDRYRQVRDGGFSFRAEEAMRHNGILATLFAVMPSALNDYSLMNCCSRW